MLKRARATYNSILSGEPGNGGQPSCLDFVEDDAAYLSSGGEKHEWNWRNKFSDLLDPLIPRRPAAEARLGSAPSRVSRL